MNLKENIMLCPKCCKTPIIIVFPVIPITIKQFCKCGEKTFLLCDYLKYLHNLHKIYNQLHCYCEELLSHSDIRASAYCINCKTALCKKCKKRHNKEKKTLFCKYMNHTQVAYCTECFELSCTLCSSHKNHNNLFLNDIKYIDVREIKKTM